MGLNLETLIGILVILILLILADGMRRMIRERHGRLRMRIDRSLRKRGNADQDDEEYPTELIGRPRVRDHDINGMDDDDEATTPPIIMEQAGEPAAPEPAHSEQQSLFDGTEADQDKNGGEESRPNVRSHNGHSEKVQADDVRSHNGHSGKVQADEARSGDTGDGRADNDARREARSSAGQPVLEVIVFHLIARRPGRFDGKAMLSLMLESGLRYGEMNIFHRHRQTGGREELQFSVANAVEPGTFDIDTMEEEEFAGITFFMKLPGPGDALGALDRMLSIGCHMAEELEGELKDEQHSVLTPQTMEHLRQRVQEFERRQRVSHGA